MAPFAKARENVIVMTVNSTTGEEAMRRMVCLVAAALIAQLAMVSGVYAEDCNPTTPTLAEIGLFDTATWICPVETQRPGRATNDSVHGDSALTYYVRVLDQRACPISGFKVLATSSDFDPTPSWEPGQILWFVVSAERRASAVDDRIGLLAPGDGCRGYIDRIEIHDIPVFRNPDQVLDHTVLFRPAAEADRSHPSRVGLEGGSYLYALGSWPPVWLSVDSADAERVITWAEVLSSRGEVAAVGANYAEHDSA